MATKIKKNRILSTDISTLEGTGAGSLITSANLAARMTDVNNASGFLRNRATSTNGTNLFRVVEPVGINGKEEFNFVSTDSANFISSTYISANAEDGISIGQGSTILTVIEEQIGINSNGFQFSIGVSGYFISNQANFRTAIGAGAINGLATLDSGGKVPESQLPDSILGQVDYQGTYNAATNTPTLSVTPAASTKGHYYIVSVAGNFDGKSYAVGDWIISNGTAWDKVDNTDAVTSVFGRLGAVTASDGDYTASQIVLGTIAGGIVTANRVELAFVQICSAINQRANINSANTFSSSQNFQDDVIIESILSASFLRTDGTGTVQAGSFGTNAGNACEGNDARLSNARTPTGTAGGSLAGTYPNPTIAATGITPGAYTNVNITVNAEGRITAISNGAGGGGGGSGHAPVADLTGTVNGTNTNFTIPGPAIVSGSELIWIDGQLMRQGASHDYTISGNTVTFNAAPTVGEWLAGTGVPA